MQNLVADGTIPIPVRKWVVPNNCSTMQSEKGEIWCTYIFKTVEDVVLFPFWFMLYPICHVEWIIWNEDLRLCLTYCSLHLIHLWNLEMITKLSIALKAGFTPWYAACVLLKKRKKMRRKKVSPLISWAAMQKKKKKFNIKI